MLNQKLKLINFFPAPTSLATSLSMHLMLTIIRHSVSHPPIIMDDSMPCGHCACPDIKVPTWISSTAAVLRPSIDPINDSKGKVNHKQALNDNHKQTHY